jgi:hypothetical protein
MLYLYSAGSRREARIRVGKGAMSSSSDTNQPSQIIIKSLAEIKSEKEKHNKVTACEGGVDTASSQTQKLAARKRRSIELYRPRPVTSSVDSEGIMPSFLFIVTVLSELHPSLLPVELHDQICWLATSTEITCLLFAVTLFQAFFVSVAV